MIDHRFPHPLKAQLSIQGGHAQLLTEFTYYDPKYGKVDVPEGFETDFASVKPLRSIAWIMLALSLAVGFFWPEAGAAIGSAGYGAFALYASVVGYGDAAATIHDWLYSTGQFKRKVADEVFFNALRSSEVAYWRASLMWCGVRIGGHFRFEKPKRRPGRPRQPAAE
ncbi:DUF1353 domain-containing protein [Pantoea sp. Tr-811]|uniref:DUF1353 domain-containing protein n=1 Tax=Pantoea sp. Tr-811 TaxID=2608361 RepID=UPI00141FF8D2|nr:DUF1353 domain-containing protein [Pantoea sp. Tr-811]NIF28904.1 DUF1353 domain-containing protein [Pantoea sp. Tr-811]